MKRKPIQGAFAALLCVALLSCSDSNPGDESETFDDMGLSDEMGLSDDMGLSGDMEFSDAGEPRDAGVSDLGADLDDEVDLGEMPDMDEVDDTGQTAANEPPGFTVVIDEDWSNGFDNYDWLVDNFVDGDGGTVEVTNGEVVWTYPAGYPGGSTAGDAVPVENQFHGPVQYARYEDIVLSENWQGHDSFVNKFSFWSAPSNAQLATRGYVNFFGADDGPLIVGVNTQGWAEFQNGDELLLWDGGLQGGTNLASPTESDAQITRGVPFTIETLVDLGSPGSADGSLRLWLDGTLILHYEGLELTRADENADFTGAHLSPVWGGVGDVVVSEQTLRFSRLYVSSGDI